jgi:4-hydroxybenzoate polyprenyltransferase
VNAKLSFGQRFRVLLVLGRVSNLPTVWSNCVAAWCLGGGGLSERFPLLCVGATLLYTGGMFLNDAFDVEFDHQYRAERPIISGEISGKAVWLIAATLLLLGWLALVPLGNRSFEFGTALLAMIVIYDAVHKRTSLAPLLMAACRFLLYLVAASAANGEVRPTVIERALALAAYIVGLSYLARNESTSGVTSRWSLPLLFAPILIAITRNSSNGMILWVAAVAQAAWVLWCLIGRAVPGRCYFSKGVAGLLAGIALVDWLAAVGAAEQLGAVFIGLFLLALLSQRFAPAT